MKDFHDRGLKAKFNLFHVRYFMFENQKEILTFSIKHAISLLKVS